MERKHSIIIFLILLSLLCSQGFTREAIISRIIDGDTIVLVGGEKIRLIGVDTPEVNYSSKLRRDANRTKRDQETIRKLGKKATEFVKDILATKVRLEFDPTNIKTNHKDRYGRTLAYVWTIPKKFPSSIKKYYMKSGQTLPKKGQELMLNRLLLCGGMAHAYYKFRYQYKKEFIRIAKNARKWDIGLWGDKEGLVPIRRQR